MAGQDLHVFSDEVLSFGFRCWTYAVLSFSQAFFVLPITMMLQDGRAPLWRDIQGRSHFKAYEMFASQEGGRLHGRSWDAKSVPVFLCPSMLEL